MRLRRIIGLALLGLGLAAPQAAVADYVYQVDFTQSVASRPDGFISVHGTVTLEDPSIRDPKAFSFTFSNDLGVSKVVDQTNGEFDFLGTGFLATPESLFVTVSEFAFTPVFSVGTFSGTPFSGLQFTPTDGSNSTFLRTLYLNSEASDPISLPGRGPFLLGVRAVPEPGSVALMGIGALGVIAYGSRRRKT